ncbi:MAG TPA: hypothetical protein VFM66_09770 [Agromyces sp.]|nr:hypothetical protein [Agromyces sp.]
MSQLDSRNHDQGDEHGGSGEHTIDDETSAVEASGSGTIPTDTRGESGVGSMAGVAGVGAVGTSFGAGGNVPEPPGADVEPVTIEDDDDPDAIAHRGETGDDTIAPGGVGPEVRPPS